MPSTADPGRVRKSGAQDLARLLEEGLVAGDQQARELPLGDFDPHRKQLGEQAGRGDLPLMMLAEYEAAQLGTKMAFDAGRHLRHHIAPVRRQPTFAPIAHDVLAKHQFLHDVVFIPLEHRARRQARDLDDPLFVDRSIGRLGAAASALAGRRSLSLDDSAFSIPEGWLGGLMSGRPFRPFSRAISSRCSMTVRLRAETWPSSSSTRALRSS